MPDQADADGDMLDNLVDRNLKAEVRLNSERSFIVPLIDPIH